MKLLENKTVIITGASRGIGRGIALVLASHGANIAFTYSKSVDSANDLINEMSEFDINCKAYQSDAASFDDSQKFVDQVIEDFGTIDVLINNAGMRIHEIFEKITYEDWKKIMTVNVDAAFLCTQALIGSMTCLLYTSPSPRD